MGLPATMSGGYLGAGEVGGRYAMMRRFAGTPQSEDIPYGWWAEKKPDENVWSMYAGVASFPIKPRNKI